MSYELRKVRARKQNRRGTNKKGQARRSGGYYSWKTNNFSYGTKFKKKKYTRR